MKVGRFVVECLLLFGENQLTASYGLKDLVFEVFLHYRKYHINDWEEQKSHKKYMCGFGPSKECLFYSRKICYTLVLELFLSLKNLEEN